MEGVMGRGNKLITTILLIALLFTTGAFVGDKAAAPERQSEKTLTGDEVKLLFLLMDTNRDGKISKQEWSRFMGSMFDRLDTGKTGDLTPKELSQLKWQTGTFASTGK
jgi:hypothetical protein